MQHQADDIFQMHFLPKKFNILIRISLKFIRKGPVDNTSILVQIMAWRRAGHNPLSDPMMTKFFDAVLRR